MKITHNRSLLPIGWFSGLVILLCLVQQVKILYFILYKLLVFWNINYFQKICFRLYFNVVSLYYDCTLIYRLLKKLFKNV